MPWAIDPNDRSPRQPESASESFSVVAPGATSVVVGRHTSALLGRSSALGYALPVDADASCREWAADALLCAVKRP
jgi:hypothetical protein